MDYDAKVNPVNGTLTVGKSGYIHDYGALAISKKADLRFMGMYMLWFPEALVLREA